MIFQSQIYKYAGYVIRLMRYIQKKQEVKIRIENENKYTALFKKNGSFLHLLAPNLEIHLYQDSVLSKRIYEGFEEEEIEFVKKILKKGDTFLDLGANVGLFTVIASKQVGIEGLVICFEPTPVIFKRLLGNCAHNKMENIDARNIGLSNEIGKIDFYISENGHDAWNSFAPSRDNKLQKKIEVNVSTLDHELFSIDKLKIKLVKIDVEGWEKFVLQGGENFFRHFSPIVMVEFTDENTFNAGYSVHEIYDIMVSYGYEWFTIQNDILIKESKKLYYPYNNLIATKA